VITVYFVQQSAQPLAKRAFMRCLTPVHSARNGFKTTTEPEVIDGHVDPYQKLPNTTHGLFNPCVIAAQSIAIAANTAATHLMKSPSHLNADMPTWALSHDSIISLSLRISASVSSPIRRTSQFQYHSPDRREKLHRRFIVFPVVN
jgi:hypothetical protein